MLHYGIFYGQTWRLPTCAGATGSGQAGVRNVSSEPDNSIKSVHRLESKMIKASEATKLEGLGGFAEYAASGKLKGKKALITGGEYVQPIDRNRSCGTDILLVLELGDPLRS